MQYGPDRLTLWDYASGRRLAELPAWNYFNRDAPESPYFWFSPDGSKLAYFSQDMRGYFQAHVWDIPGGREAFVIPDNVYAQPMAFSG